ncbi:Ser/Thr phosphatase family protein [Brevundimonas diminuta 470-4]|nr:Ser/Thr phosphatase family protein [Brevundimonas diminuta 470-4]
MKLSVACQVASLAAAALLAAAPSMALEAAGKPAPLHAPNGRWAAKGWADRIVLSPAADAARGAAVAWRTDTRQTVAEAQIAEEIDGPLLGFAARTVAGTTASIENENGRALYHQARFDGLKPDTRYVYRVRAADGWSEWLPFRTAKAEFAPFRFIYLGDTQNDILEVASRVIRSAFKEAGPAALVVHAGDLVAQRDEKVHDDEWGEWTEAGGRAFAMTPQLPASGNHEYVDHILPNGEESRALGPHWPLQFALPDNGAEGAKATSYYVDYQGVRFIVLDGTAAIDLGAGENQTRWLDQVLAESPARWNVALFHQPIYTCARPEDTEELKAAWKPIFDARNIDLVLQGHDHCYGRVSNPAGAEASRADSAAGRPQGPVYVVSVTGSKMYGLNDRADTQPVRAAENTELYQLIDVEADRLSFRAFTATGGLYDAFTLERQADGTKRLVETPDTLMVKRRCNGAAGPDDRPCTARGKD